MELYRYYPGIYPVVVNIPHAGTQIPPMLRERMTDEAAMLPDTDWFVDKLYNFARDMHVHLLVAQNTRYLVDLNRNRHEETLYPGAFNTRVIPRQMFNRNPIYRKGEEPDDLEERERLSAYWQPYHNKLLKILTFCIEQYGRVILLDAHSIKSVVPTLFEGELPELNLGTGGGESCDAELADHLRTICEESGHATVYNERFKGGYNTRHYGRPDAGCHAIQLEMAQRCYMSEKAPFDYSHHKAADMRNNVLRPMLEAMINWSNI